MNAIAAKGPANIRPDNKSKTEFIQKNHSTAVHFNFIEEAIEKLIKNKKFVNKRQFKA